MKEKDKQKKIMLVLLCGIGKREEKSVRQTKVINLLFAISFLYQLLNER
jgi:hypothetical protein